MKATFYFTGPYSVCMKKVTNSYYRMSSNQRELWAIIKKDLDLQSESMTKYKGIYIFTNSNKTPIYIGKTTSGYGNECFTLHKRKLVNEYLKNHGIYYRQVIYISFIYTSFKPKNKSERIKFSEKIDEMETHYILKGIEANKYLLNTRKIKRPWNCDELKNIFKKGKRKKNSPQKVKMQKRNSNG